ncbi:class I SAM-dependent methyltransferase [Achromobacter sp. B7]|uniref:class I SAM-dependent methyltransferase n=1 Tax=Achromobacter sp. B7 TaxID=2282475 RepID=UPI000E71A784|nr:class I SAM-dependent methyltransferase [Achromobacter sp. B7]AYD65760.1 class I SAM-dependent methyltransferase [Achromobacter sp. B7]
MGGKVDFDEHTENYNALLRESLGFFSSDDEYFARYKVDLVKKSLGAEPQRILEYGCGIGRNIPFLRDSFPKAAIDGSDVSELSLDMAREQHPDNFFFLEAGQTDGEPYDLIFVASVFHHIPPAERQRVTESLVQRLRPGGILCVFEHNPYNPITRRIVNNCIYDADAVLLKPQELKGLFKNSGLDLRTFEYCLFIPPKLKALSWIERYLGWLPLGGQYWICGTRPS